MIGKVTTGSDLYGAASAVQFLPDFFPLPFPAENDGVTDHQQIDGSLANAFLEFVMAWHPQREALLRGADFCLGGSEVGVVVVLQIVFV